MTKTPNSKIKQHAGDILKSKTFNSQKNFMQHGNYTTYDHIVSVAERSLRYAEKFHIKVNEKSMVRAALLHDYYLYDWHDCGGPLKCYWHCLRHPHEAAKNAKAEFNLTKRELRMIKRHMFPCTILPPTSREGLLISMADKACAAHEMRERRKLKKAAKKAAKKA